MLIIFLTIIILLLTSLIYILLRKCACGLFNVVWILVLFLCRNELCQKTYSQTMLVLILMIIMVNVGCVIGSIPITITLKRKPISGHKTFYGHILCVLLGLAGLIFLFYMARTVARFGFNLELIRAANNSDSDERVFNGFVDTILFYGIAMPMVYTGALCGAYNLSQRIKTSKMVYLLLALDMVLYVLTAGGRSMFIRVAIFFGAALLWRLKKSTKINTGMIAKVTFVALALLILMEVLTSARNNNSISFLEQAFTYIRGSISHMKYQLNQTAGHDLYYGYITYGGFLYYPVKIISRILGLNWQTSSEVMLYLQDYKYIQIGSRYIYYNAIVPNAFYYYFDSGYVGVITFSMLLGIGIGVGERSCYNPSFLRFVLWATAVYAITYSPLDGILWTFRYPTALVYCVLLNNFLYRSVESDDGGKNELID